MIQPSPDTEDLLDRASTGEESGVDALFDRHREKLTRMIHTRIDDRLSRRIDSSDIVQESLAEAHRRLGEYLEQRPIPFYPWLRQIAWDQIVKLHRRHVGAQKRSVAREQRSTFELSRQSLLRLAQQFIARTASPSQAAAQREMQQRVRSALDVLSTTDREVLILRHLEQLSIREIAVIQQVAEGTVKSRHFRALERLRDILGTDTNQTDSENRP